MKELVNRLNEARKAYYAFIYCTCSSVLCVSIFPDMKQTAHSPPEIIMAMIIITKSLIIKI